MKIHDSKRDLEWGTNPLCRKHFSNCCGFVGTFLLAGCLMHELGHAIGLNHSNDSSSFMYESLSPGLARRTEFSLNLPLNRGAAVGDRSFASTAVPPLPSRPYVNNSLWLTDGGLLRNSQNRQSFLSVYAAYGIGLSLDVSHNYLIENARLKRFFGDELSEDSTTSELDVALLGDELSVYEAALVDILANWDK